MAVTKFRGTRADLSRLIRSMVTELAGKGDDPYTVVRPILIRGALALLSKVQGAFIQKARGGTGDDGITWKPLTRGTIAQRRTTAGERRTLGIGGRRVRGLLTPAEDRRWRGIFRSTLAQFNARGVAGGAALAAQRAWAILKSEGAKTKLDVLGGRTVEIGRDNGALLRSLTPLTEETQSLPEGQILEAEAGRITVGSNLSYALHFHKSRPLWPEKVPEVWMEAVAQAVAKGAMEAIVQRVALES